MVSGQRDVLSIGWIGEHPRDGSDVAHLMLYPAGAGVAEGMELLAGEVGAVRASEARTMPASAARATQVDGWVWLDIDGGQLAGRPVDSEWAAAAHAHRMVLLTVAMDPLPGVGLEAVESVLGRPDRVFIAAVALR